MALQQRIGLTLLCLAIFVCWLRSVQLGVSVVPTNHHNARTAPGGSNVHLGVNVNALSSSGSGRAVNSSFAYAFLVTGCDPARPNHVGFLINVMVSARLLQRLGSQADRLVLVQMAHTSPASRLPPRQEEILQALGVRILYIPKNPYESFYESMLEKFRILDLIDYQRVISLDADVMPLTNLDYLFDLSVTKHNNNQSPTIRENFVIADGSSPANGGFFMVAPGPGRLTRVQQIIRHREALGQQFTDTADLFDIWQGWGHEIVAPDCWQTRRECARNWTFYGANTDQGLLYHWVKYERQDVSILIGNRLVHHWTDAGTLQRREQSAAVLGESSRAPLVRHADSCRKWMCGFAHFTGDSKPWLKAPPQNWHEKPLQSARHLWFATLSDLNQEFGMGLNVSRAGWVIPGRPSLGMFPTNRMIAQRVKRKADPPG